MPRIRKIRHMGLTIKCVGMVNGVRCYRVPHLQGGSNVFPSVGAAMQAIEAFRERQRHVGN